MIFEHVLRTFENIARQVEQPKTWAVVTALMAFINQYIFSQWNFAIGFFMIFILDTIVGSYCAFQNNEFSFKKFRKMLCDKSIAYFSIIISYSVGTKIVLEDGTHSIIQYMDIPFYSLFVTVEFGSIVKNWYQYKKWPWLRPLMKHFEGFNSVTGKEEK